MAAVPAPSFSTSRLVFRAPAPADFERPDGFLDQLLRDPELVHGLTASSVLPMSREQVDKFFKTCGEEAAIHCVFSLRPTDTDTDDETQAQTSAEVEKEVPVGWVVLHKIAGLHRKATFGLAVAPVQRRNGFAKEAMEWLLERAFNGFGLNKVEGDVFGWNEAARPCYKSVGFVEEGCRRQTVWQNGAFRDDYSLGLLASEWRERHSQKIDARESACDPEQKTPL
ncbi:hypothetical protein JCM11491_002269 [Sporobolomyces phaffii]